MDNEVDGHNDGAAQLRKVLWVGIRGQELVTCAPPDGVGMHGLDKHLLRQADKAKIREQFVDLRLTRPLMVRIWLGGDHSGEVMAVLAYRLQPHLVAKCHIMHSQSHQVLGGEGLAQTKLVGPICHSPGRPHSQRRSHW